MNDSSPRFGVYVHFPYCRKRCPYCDFAVSAQNPIPHEAYRDALLRELSARARWFPGRQLESIYFGGGTPSLWQTDCICQALAHIQETFGSPSGIQPEITMECDPLDLLERPSSDWHAFQKSGIHRLSIGIQSLNDIFLQKLGRLHTKEQGQACISQAKSYGFSNISVDLMIGLPNQTLEELHTDVRAFIELDVPHVSIYQLTIEPSTVFARAVKQKRLLMPDNAMQAQAYERTQEWLKEGGFSQYEIASHARTPAFRSRHNQLYWSMGEYLGIGVSAHSLRLEKNGAGERFSNDRSVQRYLQQSFTVTDGPHQDPALALYEARPPKELQKEAIWVGLRQLDGLSRAHFKSLFGQDPLLVFPNEIEQLCKQNWVQIEGDRIKLTQQGVWFADEAALPFVGP